MEWFALAVLCALTVGGQPPGECLADPGTVCESVKTTPLIFPVFTDLSTTPS